MALVAVGFEEQVIIHEWPYDKFLIYARAVARREASSRATFITDVRAAVESLLSGKDATLFPEVINGIQKDIDENS